MSAKPTHRSHLFLLRVWQEHPDQPQVDVRIQVRHVLTGETHNFRGWQPVMAYLATRVAGLAADGDHDEDPPW